MVKQNGKIWQPPATRWRHLASHRLNMKTICGMFDPWSRMPIILVVLYCNMWLIKRACIGWYFGRRTTPERSRDNVPPLSLGESLMWILALIHFSLIAGQMFLSTRRQVWSLSWLQWSRTETMFAPTNLYKGLYVHVWLAWAFFCTGFCWMLHWLAGTSCFPYDCKWMVAPSIFMSTFA